MSETAKRDSITISRTMGTASRSTARPSGTLVRSWCSPRRAWRTLVQNGTRVLSAGAEELSGGSDMRLAPVQTGGLCEAGHEIEGLHGLTGRAFPEIVFCAHENEAAGARVAGP